MAVAESIRQRICNRFLKQQEAKTLEFKSTIDPKMQVVQGKTVCLVICQRSPEPVFLKWKGTEADATGDFYARSGPETTRLEPQSAEEYIRTRYERSCSPPVHWRIEPCCVQANLGAVRSRKG